MEDKKIIKKIKEWLISDMGEESYPQAVRMNSMALLEYIEKWENQKRWIEKIFLNGSMELIYLLKMITENTIS